LSLLARKKKLPSKKVGNVWYTTREALDSYMQRQMMRAQISNHGTPLPASEKASAARPNEVHLEKLRSYTSDVNKYFPITDADRKELHETILKVQSEQNQNQDQIPVAVSTEHVEKALEKVLD